MPKCKWVKEFNVFKYQEFERVHQFLMGLDTNQFGVARSNILSLEPLPNLDKVYSTAEDDPGMEMKNNTEAMAFKAAASKLRTDNRSKCTHCQKLGHEKKNRYELVGYPPNWGNKRQNWIDLGQNNAWSRSVDEVEDATLELGATHGMPGKNQGLLGSPTVLPLSEHTPKN